MRTLLTLLAIALPGASVQNFKGPCVCDTRLMPQCLYLVFVKFDGGGARQSGPIIAFPNAERFLSPLRAIVGVS